MLNFCARLRLISFTLSFLLYSSGAFANEDAKEDMDALKAEFNAQIEALNNRELEASVVSAHAEIVLYGIFCPFPVNGKADFKKAVQPYFGQYEAAELSPVTPQFRIVGTTGLAWGHYHLAATPQGGRLTYAHGRYLFTYVKVAGKWLVLGMDYSPLESYRFAP